MSLRASPVKELALAHHLRIEQPKSLKDPASQAMLGLLDYDLMVVAAYGLILPRAVLDQPRLGCVNIHGSLLPRWRGAAPIVRAIEHGDAQTGICIMKMEAGLDTGPVYSTHTLAIDAYATAATLHDSLASLGAVALLQALPGIASGSLVPQPQADEGVTYASKIVKNEAPIDWSLDAVTLNNKIRAFDPFPGATTLWQGQVLKVWGSRLTLLSDLEAAPGTVIAAGSDSFLIATGRGVLEITALQKAGARRVSGPAMRQSIAMEVGEQCQMATT